MPWSGNNEDAVIGIKLEFVKQFKKLPEKDNEAIPAPYLCHKYTSRKDAAHEIMPAFESQSIQDFYLIPWGRL